jgi:hypothetical protein
MKIPAGYMLVPMAWAPIMAEVDRRAEKMSGDSEFTVTVSADDLAKIDATQPPGEFGTYYTFAEYLAKSRMVTRCDATDAMEHAFKAGQNSLKGPLK